MSQHVNEFTSNTELSALTYNHRERKTCTILYTCTIMKNAQSLQNHFPGTESMSDDHRLQMNCLVVYWKQEQCYLAVCIHNRKMFYISFFAAPFCFTPELHMLPTCLERTSFPKTCCSTDKIQIKT